MEMKMNARLQSRSTEPSQGTSKKEAAGSLIKNKRPRPRFGQTPVENGTEREVCKTEAVGKGNGA